MTQYAALVLGTFAVVFSGCCWLCPPPPCADCATACCYVQAANPAYKEAGCFEYTGPTDLVAEFKQECANTKSLSEGFAISFPVDGKCSQARNGVKCVTGSTENAVRIPSDSNCCP